MKNMRFLVTGIGGDLAQCFVRILRQDLSKEGDLFILGTDIHEGHAGHLFCSHFELLPKVNDQNYLEKLTALLNQNSIDILIPSTEHDLRFLLDNEEAVPARLFGFNREIADI